MSFGTALARPSVVFLPEASFGATLNCITLAQELRTRGVACKFLVRSGFAGVFREYGFEEHLLSQGHGTTSVFWSDFLEKRVPHFRASPAAQLDRLVAPTYEACLAEVEATEPGLKAALNLLRPDVVVIDDVIMYPSVVTCGCPWVRLNSTSETEIWDPLLPPKLSGLSPGQPEHFAPFLGAYIRSVGAVHARYNAFRARHGLAPLGEGSFMDTSPHLNILIAPTALRLGRAEPLPECNFLFLEHNVRRESPFELPILPRNEGPLVYVSFGSLGSLDTGFIRDMIRALASAPARFLVNVGSRIDDYSHVPDNVHVQPWFPQPSVVALCDLFVHHGGLSSTCEALLNGVPSLVIPYFWDGHDTALRLEEAGLGRRLLRAELDPERLIAMIADLLADSDMKARLARNSERMRSGRSTADAADRILALLDSVRGAEGPRAGNLLSA